MKPTASLRWFRGPRSKQTLAAGLIVTWEDGTETTYNLTKHTAEIVPHKIKKRSGFRPIEARETL